jgi:hypothetical protein
MFSDAFRRRLWKGAVMMSNTPRVFVGTTTFLIAGMTSRIDLQTVTTAINGVPGIRVLAAAQNGLVTVTADRPVNRCDLTAAIIQAGYTVLA